MEPSEGFDDFFHYKFSEEEPDSAEQNSRKNTAAKDAQMKKNFASRKSNLVTKNARSEIIESVSGIWIDIARKAFLRHF